MFTGNIFSNISVRLANILPAQKQTKTINTDKYIVILWQQKMENLPAPNVVIVAGSARTLTVLKSAEIAVTILAKRGRLEV